MNHAAHLRRQKGQTLLLVAVALVGFVAMCALAIDLTSLYAARSEIQRAANATALAGAKAFVDSGVMTDPSVWTSVAQPLASAYVTAAAAQNLVANAPAKLASGSPTFSPSAQNPYLTVKLQSASLPLFFAHIWGSRFATVSATATAEAYNPGQPGSSSSSFTPSAPKCVKPLLVPNIIPRSNPPLPFVTSNGNVTTGQQLVGLDKVDMRPAPCSPSNQNCNLGAGDYLPMSVTGAPAYCPSSSAQGCGQPSKYPDYQEEIECCDGRAFSAFQCGPKTSMVAWDPNVDPAAPPSAVSAGLKCLIHSPQQDSIDPKNAFSGGNGLLVDPGTFSQTEYSLGSKSTLLTSDSIITVPIFDQKKLKAGNQNVVVVGFLTLFVKDVNPNPNKPGVFSTTILNVTGCGPSATGTPISGGGVSAIPVRLIQAP